MPALLFILWLLLNGRITPEILLFGAAVTGLIYWFMLRFLKWNIRRDLRMLRAAPLFLLYLLNLIREVVSASWHVARLACSRSERPKPEIITFHSGLTRKSLNVILANSITLTPGTVTVALEGDRLVVQALRKEYADGIEECSFVRLLRRFPE